MSELLTFDGWRAQGRRVRSGEKAKQYLVTNDYSEGYPLYTTEQTRPSNEIDPQAAGWHVISAQEWKDRNRGWTPGDKRPRVIIGHKNGTLNLWCGPSAKVIAWMKEMKWRFEPNSHRWWKRGPVEKAVELADFYEEQGFAVKREYHDPNGPPL